MGMRIKMEILSQLLLFSLEKFVDEKFNNLHATLTAILLKENCFSYENFFHDCIPPVGFDHFGSLPV